MFRQIEYGADREFIPVKVTGVKSNGQLLSNKVYNSEDIICGKSLLTRDKNFGESKILNLMKELNGSK